MSAFNRSQLLKKLTSLPVNEQETLLSIAVDGLLTQDLDPQLTDGSSMNKESEVQMIREILLMGVKQDLKTDGLNDALKELGLKVSVPDGFFDSLRSKLTAKDNSSSALPIFENMDWRLQTELCKSYLLDKMKPEVVLKLEFEGRREKVNLTCDIPTLYHLRTTVEEALAAAKDPSLQKVLRKLR